MLISDNFKPLTRQSNLLDTQPINNGCQLLRASDKTTSQTNESVCCRHLSQSAPWCVQWGTLHPPPFTGTSTGAPQHKDTGGKRFGTDALFWRHVGAPGRPIIWHPFMRYSLHIFDLEQGLAKVFLSVGAQISDSLRAPSLACASPVHSHHIPIVPVPSQRTGQLPAWPPLLPLLSSYELPVYTNTLAL